MRHFFLCIVMLLAACDSSPRPQSLPTETLTITTQTGETHRFEVQIADDLEEQQTGLMHRKKMDDDAGMLFVFPDEAPRRFWMKDTLIPLDLLFTDESGIIFHIHKNAKPLDLTGLPSYGNAKMVLEINGGLADELGITEGSRLTVL